MPRFRWMLALVVAAGVALLVTYRAEVAMWVMERALDRNFTADPIAELPDGLHLAVCGAGAPLPAAERSGPCLGVIAGDRLFVVDAGSDGARNLQRMGFGAGRVDAVFLTHFHSDHIDGLGELGMLRWTGGNHDAPLPVYGPAGVEQVVTGFNQAYALDAGYRTAHHGAVVAPPGGAGMVAQPFDAPAGSERTTVWEGGGVTVSTFSVPHDPVTPAVGYRFDYADRSLVISGDTRRSDTVTAVSAGVDLLAHEALAAHLVDLMTRAAEGAPLSNAGNTCTVAVIAINGRIHTQNGARSTIAQCVYGKRTIVASLNSRIGIVAHNIETTRWIRLGDPEVTATGDNRSLRVVRPELHLLVLDRGDHQVLSIRRPKKIADRAVPGVCTGITVKPPERSRCRRERCPPREGCIVILKLVDRRIEDQQRVGRRYDRIPLRCRHAWNEETLARGRKIELRTRVRRERSDSNVALRIRDRLRIHCDTC